MNRRQGQMVLNVNHPSGKRSGDNSSGRNGLVGRPVWLGERSDGANIPKANGPGANAPRTIVRRRTV